MGAGLAFECKLRYPEMFTRYEELCTQGLLSPGKLWLYQSAPKSVLCFPTKSSWKLPSKLEYLETGLENFVTTYEKRKITSAAFPLLGADRGGLSADLVEQTMTRFLSKVSDMIDIEIYHYDPKAKDELFDKFAAQFIEFTDTELAQITEVTERRIAIVRAGIEGQRIYQLNQLTQLPGIGEASLEKIFSSVMAPTDATGLQQGLGI